MAIVTETYLICDNCGKYHGADDGAKLRHIKGVQHRKIAVTDGWLYSYNKDLCPQCRPKRKDGQNIKTRRKKK